MQTAKKILLSLIFTFCLIAIPESLFNCILDIIKPPWFVGDEGIDIIFAWIMFVLFLLAVISSFCWIKNIGNGFWLWKLPALLILPFSIPFLIIDYLESRKSKVIVEKSMSKKSKTIIVWIIFSVNLFFLLNAFTLSFVFYEVISHWFLIALIFYLISIVSSIFLVISSYHPKKIFKFLSWFGLPTNWFCLFLDIVDKKQIHYFFKSNSKNDTPLIVQEIKNF